MARAQPPLKLFQGICRQASPESCLSGPALEARGVCRGGGGGRQRPPFQDRILGLHLLLGQ